MWGDGREFTEKGQYVAHYIISHVTVSRKSKFSDGMGCKPNCEMHINLYSWPLNAHPNYTWKNNIYIVLLAIFLINSHYLENGYKINN